MLRSGFITLLFLATAIPFYYCTSPTLSFKDAVKFQKNDPFGSTMTESQFFEINADSGQVIMGKEGIRMVFPKGCFVDKNGKTVAGKVRIELTEALHLNDQLMSNLTTMSDGKLLETGGMMYWNATANGAQTGVKPDLPVYIEIPTLHKLPGMSAYTGERDENGNMNWIDPQPMDDGLTAVDIFTLDFLPKGFAAEVAQNIPFGPYKTATKALTDSLYFSLSGGAFELDRSDFTALDYNEPYYNTSSKVVDGKYTNESYLVSERDTFIEPVHGEAPQIDPAMIRVMQSEKFQNTLIATREFEQRLQVIFQTCLNPVLELYINNPDKNLWEIDLMAAGAAEKSGEPETAKKFRDFAEQKLTKVKNDDVHSKLLSAWFKEQLANVRAEIEDKKKTLRTQLDKKSAEIKQVAEAYKDLLWKREQFRMNAYKFEWTSTGWINVDRGTEPKTWFEQPLEVVVDNGGSFDRVYTYVVFQSIRSLYRTNTADNIHFFVGNKENKKMLMPKSETEVVIAIAYRDTQVFEASFTFKPGEDTNITLHPTATKMAFLKEDFGKYSNFNDALSLVEEDLAFMEKFYKEQVRQKSLQRDREMMYRLSGIAFPCLDQQGMTLFFRHCASCHNSNMNDKLTGPALAHAQTLWNDDKALYDYIRHSQQSISRGVPRAVQLWDNWKPTMMNDFEQLSDQDITAILHYIAHKK